MNKLIHVPIKRPINDFLIPPEIILYSDTRKENSTNFISNFEKLIFLDIPCKP